MKWYTADEHYEHKNQHGTGVIEYCNRPFKDLDDMHESQVERHNSVVKKGDQVYHLGDFAFHSVHKWISKLNGTHYLIRGTHDPGIKKIPIDPKNGFVWVKDVCKVKYEKQDIFLSHYAHRVWPRSHHGSWHLFGHSHGGLEMNGKSMDVGVDSWNFYPVSFDQVKEILDKQPIINREGLR